MEFLRGVEDAGKAAAGEKSPTDGRLPVLLLASWLEWAPFLRKKLSAASKEPLEARLNLSLTFHVNLRNNTSYDMDQLNVDEKLDLKNRHFEF